VSNDSQGVSIAAEGEPDSVERFLAALEREATLLAMIARVTHRKQCAWHVFAPTLPL
jgi:hydrogenase maturation factor HypF (carbamoyltransferase family)